MKSLTVKEFISTWIQPTMNMCHTQQLSNSLNRVGKHTNSGIKPCTISWGMETDCQHLWGTGAPITVSMVHGKLTLTTKIGSIARCTIRGRPFGNMEWSFDMITRAWASFQLLPCDQQLSHNCPMGQRFSLACVTSNPSAIIHQLLGPPSSELNQDGSRK